MQVCPDKVLRTSSKNGLKAKKMNTACWKGSTHRKKLASRKECKKRSLESCQRTRWSRNVSHHNTASTTLRSSASTPKNRDSSKSIWIFIFICIVKSLCIARTAPSPPRPYTGGTSLFGCHHVVCPFPVESARGSEISAQDSLLVLINCHLPTVEALEMNNVIGIYRRWGEISWRSRAIKWQLCIRW